MRPRHWLGRRRSSRRGWSEYRRRAGSRYRPIVRATAVGTDPAALAVSADAVWAGNVGDRHGVTHRRAHRHRSRPPGRRGVPSAIVAFEDTVFVADAFAGTLTTIDTRTNAVTDTRSIRGRAIAAGFGSLWLSDHVAGAVTVVNPHTMAVDAQIPLPPDSDLGDIVATGDAICVADRAANLLHRIDPTSRSVIGAVALCCRPTAMAWALGSIWVTSAERDRLCGSTRSPGPFSAAWTSPTARPRSRAANRVWHAWWPLDRAPVRADSLEA